MSAQDHIRLFRGNQEELRIRLPAAHPVIGVQLLQAQVGQVSRVPVAVEVARERHVDPHIFENLRERRGPILALIEGLYGVPPMPVGSQRLVSGKRGKPVTVREAKDILQRRLRRPVRDHIEHAEPLDGRGRGVDPRIILPCPVVDGMPNAETELAAPGPSGPPVKPNVPHVRGVVARRNVGVRRRKYRETAGVQLSGNRPVPDIRRPAIGTRGHLRAQLSLRVVVRDRRDHLPASRPHPRSGRASRSPVSYRYAVSGSCVETTAS